MFFPLTHALKLYKISVTQLTMIITDKYGEIKIAEICVLFLASDFSHLILPYEY